jgi:hypothetical protein
MTRTHPKVSLEDRTDLSQIAMGGTADTVEYGGIGFMEFL